MAALTFYNNIPTASQRLRDSQPQFLTNFASLQTFLETNHVAFSAANSGKHKFLQLPEQSSAPTVAANEMGLYTKEQGSVSQLFVRRESDGTEINLTNPTSSIVTSGYTTLVNGLIIKWGVTGNLAGNTTTTASFPVAFPTNCFAVVCTGYQTSSGNQLATITAYNASGFTVFNRQLIGISTVIKATYIAIGN